ncbi:MAG TPA: hypothetical protein VIH48_00435, partial [Candidatus Bathyarchaeia archaeon]
MNWKNVLLLISVETKSSRLIRGLRFRRFRESRKVTYALYSAACILGLLAGWIVAYFYSGITDPAERELFLQSATSLFMTLPTIALIYGLVFSLMSQMQRAGVKMSFQPIYWFPITWE